jgi:hypothetical protein
VAPGSLEEKPRVAEALVLFAAGFDSIVVSGVPVSTIQL